MLTDIFAERYVDTKIWEEYTQKEERLLVQAFRIFSEQLFPYWSDGKENPESKKVWSSIHDKLSMELGLQELSPKAYCFQSTYNGKPLTQSGTWSMDRVCEAFVISKFDGNLPADRFIKERLSFVELAFREREEQIRKLNSNLPNAIETAKKRHQELKYRTNVIRLAGDPAERVIEFNRTNNEAFRASVDELNERFRRANSKINYHNGFIQISEDEVIETQIENPFWKITNDPIWTNVDIDMKEALDRRDSGGRDPAFYAARSLESAIKIISDQKGWTHGGEKGAHNYLDNLGSKKNGSFIQDWEKESLKSFFTHVRNPFGHGPGSEEMPSLTKQQTDWSIESCMSWIKTLISRM